jgi:glucosamine-6-phosphate deaminase
VRSLRDRRAFASPGATTIELRIVSPDSFASAACDALLQICAEFERPAVGLATGSTPIGMYAGLARSVASGEASVHSWKPFAIDEYVCPAEHPCANRAFFQRHWGTIPGAAPVSQFDVSVADLAAEAQRFGASLTHRGGLDVALLGIGRNGHLAFNEPGSVPESMARLVTLSPESRASAAACFDEVPRQGMTLGLAELLGARRVLLLASGSHKAGIVATTLRGLASSACPASFVRQHPNAIMLLDDDAAALLDG